MYPHHETAIARVIERFAAEERVLGILLAGSIAHGTESEASDVDIMLVVSDDELTSLRAQNASAFSDTPLAGYEGGYIDVKYASPGYLADVAERGSEPSRFAFDGSQVLFSRIDGLDDLVAAASRYPIEVRDDRIARFAAQVDAWTWMSGEAEKKGNPYLMATATSRVALFGGRMLLAHNHMLYPFHKWFLRQLEAAPDKPEGIVELIREVTASPSGEGARRLSETVLGFREWQRGEISWPNHFIHDTEQSWMRDAAAVEDL
jgi:hypothetical protein